MPRSQNREVENHADANMVRNRPEIVAKWLEAEAKGETRKDFCVANGGISLRTLIRILKAAGLRKKYVWNPGGPKLPKPPKIPKIPKIPIILKAPNHFSISLCADAPESVIEEPRPLVPIVSAEPVAASRELLEIKEEFETKPEPEDEWFCCKRKK